MPSTDTHEPATGAFTQAAKAAEELLDHLEAHKSALDEIADLRDGASALRQQLADAVEPTRALAGAARDAAKTYQAVESVRPAVEGSLGGLKAAADSAAISIGAAAVEAAEQAGRRIETSAASAAATVETSTSEAQSRIDAAMALLAGGLEAVEAAAVRLEAMVKTDGTSGAEALVAALADATARVGQDARETLTALRAPVESAGQAVMRAQETAEATRVALQAATAETEAALRSASVEVQAAAIETRAGLARSVAEASTHLVRELTASEKGFQESRVQDLRRLTGVAWATLLAVVLVAILVLARGWGSDKGMALAESTVQVLNGVNPDSSFAAEVASQLSTGEGGVVRAVVRADAATTRQAQTLVLVHGASMAAGRELAGRLGLDAARVRPATPLPFAGDVTVLLGADFRTAITARTVE